MSPEVRIRRAAAPEVRRPSEFRRLGIDPAGIVHQPYAQHVVIRRTSGVAAVLAAAPTLCVECFPAAERKVGRTPPRKKGA